MKVYVIMSSFENVEVDSIFLKKENAIREAKRQLYEVLIDIHKMEESDTQISWLDETGCCVDIWIDIFDVVDSNKHEQVTGVQDVWVIYDLEGETTEDYQLVMLCSSKENAINMVETKYKFLFGDYAWSRVEVSNEGKVEWALHEEENTREIFDWLPIVIYKKKIDA